MIWCIIFSNNSWMQTLHLCLRAWTTVTLGWSVKYLTFPCCWFIVFTILPKYYYYSYKFSQIIYAVILFTTPFVVYLSIWMDVIFHSHRYRSKTLLDNYASDKEPFCNHLWSSFHYNYIYMSYDILCHGVKPLCFLYNACTFKKFNIFSLRLFDIQEIHWDCTFPMRYYIFEPDSKLLYSYRELN